MLAASFLQHWKSDGMDSFYFLQQDISSFGLMKVLNFLSITFYLISYLIFYIFALHDYFRRNILSTSDILILALANFPSIHGASLHFDTLKYDPPIVFPLIFAAVNAILLFREYTRKKLWSSLFCICRACYQPYNHCSCYSV